MIRFSRWGQRGGIVRLPQLVEDAPEVLVPGPTAARAALVAG
jgi:hypothetical protein